MNELSRPAKFEDAHMNRPNFRLRPINTDRHAAGTALIGPYSPPRVTKLAINVHDLHHAIMEVQIAR